MNEITVTVPGSKSITQRALVCSALADGISCLLGPLESEDPVLLKEALKVLGINTDVDNGTWIVHGKGGALHAGSSPTSIYMGNNGTGIRFLTALCCLVKEGGPIELYGDERMAERPIRPLLDALISLGAAIKSKFNTGCPPVIINPTGGLKGGDALVDSSKSSQYLSALLLVAPYAKRKTTLRLSGPLASGPYLDITIRVMKAFGIEVEKVKDGGYTVPQGTYRATRYLIEGDASSASYFFGAAAITGKTVTVANIPEDSMQGDAGFVHVLEKMGCRVSRSQKGTSITGPASNALRGIAVSMKDMPDMVPTLAAIAPFALGKTVITDCPHLRIKETDRIRAMATELSKIGARVEELPDGLIIEGGGDLRPARIHTYNDHRIAMSFAMVGLRVPGLQIENPECVRKSFPDFWSKWKSSF